MQSRDSIAIVGIGCRFAGAKDVESFWRVLRDGIETVRDYPGNRFCYIDTIYSEASVRLGRIASRRGGFLDNLDGLDAAFFQLSPREAELLDPQQRLLMEVAWEAIEDAGLPGSHLAGSKTGVFVGLWTSDYEDCVYESARDPEFYATTGGGRYPAAGRLAYLFDLRGPSLTVDTACSSSLVAIHLACESLQRGECAIALAGGVNVILRPEVTLAYSGAKMLSPEGRCKFGDAAADGYVRSEGAGIVVLKPFSRALADRDHIYAVIRGSVVNNDGRSSGSLIAPSRQGQVEMLSSALRAAGVRPESIDYIEAHGTGTLAGDPVEIEAISRVVTSPERKKPCAVGSIKTNLGHTESAAGVAGIIKVALALEQRTIPASLHFKTPNPNIDWGDGSVVMQTQTAPWTSLSGAPIGGVSGFGITGTNAHIVLQAVEPPSHSDIRENEPELLVLSGHTEEVLRAQAAEWLARLAADESWPRSLRDLAYTSTVRRTHHDFRLAIVAENRADLRHKLEEWIANRASSNARSSKRSSNERRRAVFVFPGQGGQWSGVGRTLLRDEPVFREALNQCDVEIHKCTGWKVTDRLLASDADCGFDEIEVIQPVLFGLMVGLAALWRSYGIEPEAVVGHSMGEVAAAAVSGALSLADAARVICSRSRLMKRASGRGLMAVVELSLEECSTMLRAYGDRVSVAANNSPTSTVLSGDADAIEDLLKNLESREIFCRKIKVDVASHSAHMEPLRKELEQSLHEIRPRKASCPLYSTSTGGVEDGTQLDARYWSRNLRQPVLFSSAVQRLLQEGFDTFVEINAHPVLLQAVEDGIRHAERDAIVVASLRRDKPERAQVLEALGGLYVSGFPVDFAQLYPEGECLRLPAYAWQRERFWIEPEAGKAWAGRGSQIHPNLADHIESSDSPGKHYWQAEIAAEEDPNKFSSLLLQISLAATSEVLGAGPLILEDVELSPPLEKGNSIQVVISPASTDARSIVVSQRAEAGWRLLLTATAKRSVDKPSKVQIENSRDIPLEEGGRETLGSCLQLAADAFEESTGSTPRRVKRIASLLWRGMESGRLVARCSVQKSSNSTEAICRLENSGSDLLVELAGVSFEVASESSLSENVFEFEWVLCDPPPQKCLLQGTWIISGDSANLGQQLANFLSARGASCVRITGEDDLSSGLEAAGKSCRGVVYIQQAKSGEPLEAMQEAGDIIKLVQAIVASRVANPPRLWIVSSGAWAVAGEPRELVPGQGPSWGLGRVIAREHPEFSVSNVDLSRNPSEEDCEILVRLMAQNGPEEQLAVRSGLMFAGRFKKDSQYSITEPAHFSPNAIYLLTGGLGGIGIRAARWLVDAGVRRLALIGRRPPSVEANEQLKALQSAGVEIRTFQADVANSEEMTAVFAKIACWGWPLRGILHLAVVTEGDLLVDLKEGALRRVMEPKVAGAWNLHKLSERMELDFFVLFSSVAAVLSQPGQGSYAAANAYLDALAQYRRALGLKAISIQWGPWAGVGLARKEAAIRSVRAYQEQGIPPLPVNAAKDTLICLFKSEAANRLVLPINFEKFSLSFAGDKAPRAFVSLMPACGYVSAEQEAQESIRDRMIATPVGRPRRTLLESHLQQALAQVLKSDASRIDPAKPLGSFGVDSLLALQFVRRLAPSTSVRLPATAVFNFPTIRLLAAEVARRMEIPLEGEISVSVKAAASSARPVLAALGVEGLSEEEALGALVDKGGPKT